MIEGNYATFYKSNTGRKLGKTLGQHGIEVELLLHEDIGLRWIRNPIVRFAVEAFHKITNIPGLRCFKRELVCVARKKAR